MIIWPSHNGLPVPVEELGFDVVPHERGRTNNHHTNWPRSRYDGVRYREVYRNLVSNVVTLPVDQHHQLHHMFRPPRMPADDIMIGVVEEHLSTFGAINCVREKRTNEVYQIQASYWEIIKGQYKSNRRL